MPLELRKYLYELFEDSVDGVLRAIRKEMSADEPISTVDLQLVGALCNLLECFLTEQFGFKLKEWTAPGSGIRPEYIKRSLAYIYAFAFTWSVCATVHEQHIDRMNTLVRDSFPSVIFPSVDTVYSYFLDIQ